MRLVDYSGWKRPIPWGPYDAPKVDPSVQYFGSGVVSIGEGSRIDAGCILIGNVRIGRRTHIAPYCLLYGAYDITIGDLCNLGAMCVLHTESESFDGSALMGPLVPERVRRPDRGRIKLENLVTVGVRSTILPRVLCERGVSIGAHSLVKSGTYYERGIYAGTPATWLKDMSPTYLELAKEWL
jgi:carbonic anhydrase/acetyltransferase-like protein (isoleucine patch superfamily)